MAFREYKPHAAAAASEAASTEAPAYWVCLALLLAIAAVALRIASLW